MNALTETQFTLRQWTKATFLGWLLGVILIIILSSFLDSIGIEHMQFYIGVGMGAGVGFLQWFMVKKYLSFNTNWIWTSIAGMGLPFIIFDLILEQNVIYKLPLSVALGGLTVGLLQYFILKKYSKNASIWILGCFLGWTLAALAVLTINYTMKIKTTGIFLLGMAVLNLIIILSGGVILGIITGKVFYKLR